MSQSFVTEGWFMNLLTTHYHYSLLTFHILYTHYYAYIQKNSLLTFSLCCRLYIASQSTNQRHVVQHTFGRLG